MNLWIGVAIAVVAALATYAIYLHLKLRQRERLAKHQIDALVADQKQARENAERSVLIIANAVINKQCPVGEGCIRVTALLTRIDPTHADNESYRALFQVADALSHIPLMDRWEALSNRERAAFRLEVEETEEKFRPFVMESMRAVLEAESHSHQSTDSGVRHFG